MSRRSRKPAPGPLAALAVCLVASALAGCSGGGDRDSDERGSLAWRTCPQDDRADCATLTVPADWSVTGGPTIELAIIRYRATVSSERIGVLLTNPGGPGASGKQFVLGRPFTTPITERFDIVSWDPRGVGDSTPLSCGGLTVRNFLADDPSPDDPTEQSDLDDDARALADQCARQDESLVGHLGTRETVQDMDAIRAALGEDTISYVGFSYGSLYGLRYAEAHPERLRAWVLDGVVDPSQDLEAFLLGQASAFQAAFERAIGACGQRPSCPLGADPMDAATTLAADVEVSPLPVDADGSGAAPGIDAVTRLGPAELSAGYVEALYDPSDWPRLWSAIAAGLDGDGTGMGRLAAEYYDFAGFTAYAATTCVDVSHPGDASAYAAFAARAVTASPLLGAGIANEMLPCVYWPAGLTGDVGPVTALGAPPSLVIGRTGDPATPYANAITVAGQVHGAHLVTSTGDGHTSYNDSDCVHDVVDRYLVGLELPPTDPQCA